MNLHFEDRGTGFPVLFLHAFPLDGSMWALNVESVIAAGFRAITIDLPGFGRSTGQIGDLRATAADVIALAESLGLESIGVCGLSMGGYIALEVIGLAPQMIRAAVLCDTTSDADTAEKRMERMSAIRNINNEGREAFMDGLIQALLSPSTFSNNPALVARVRSCFDIAPDSAIIAAMQAMADRNSNTETLAGFEFPVLLVFGEDDPAFAAGSKMDRLLPDSQLVTIGNAGHYSNLEAPDEFNSALTGFLRRQKFEA